MAEHASTTRKNPITRILQVLKLEKKEITSIYFYAILNGLLQLSLPLGIQSIIGFVIGGSMSTSLVILITLVVLGVLFNGFISVQQMQLIEKIQQQLFVRYSFEYAYKIPRLDLKSVDKYYLPELVNRFFDTISLQKGISKLLLEIPTATIQIIFGTVLLSLYHPVFIIFSLILISLVGLILYFTSPRGLATSYQESDYKYRVAGWLEELARVIRSFKYSKGSFLNMRKTDEYVTGYLNARTSHFKVLKLQYWTLISFKVVITAAMLIMGSILFINQQLNLGQFVAAELVIILVLGSVEKLILHLDKVYDVLTSVEKLGKITDLGMDEEGAVEFPDNHRGVNIQVHNLAFDYDTELVLKNISFDILPGQKVAVMGADGSGKSSLLRVMSGVYKDFSGGILMDSIPLRNYHADSLRAKTGILLSAQDIFNGTILENITMGDKNIRPDEVMRLSESVGLKDFLEGQPHGFETVLDPVGKRLSRTVIQKILLLRALVNGPRLLLLEEPWSGFEPAMESQIKNYLLSQKDCTILVATNDEDYAAKCDQVLYLEDGHLVAKGPFHSINRN